MQGVLPAKASAFTILIRPGGAILYTLERSPKDAPGTALKVGLPGGKWELKRDGCSWDRVADREFEEETGHPVPAAVKSGYLEWGSDRYQTRFRVLVIDEKTAASIPDRRGCATDPDGAVREIRWMKPANVARAGEVRPHVAAALCLLRASRLVYGEVTRPAAAAAVATATTATSSTATNSTPAAPAAPKPCPPAEEGEGDGEGDGEGYCDSLDGSGM